MTQEQGPRFALKTTKAGQHYSVGIEEEGSDYITWLGLVSPGQAERERDELRAKAKLAEYAEPFIREMCKVSPRTPHLDLLGWLSLYDALPAAPPSSAEAELARYREALEKIAEGRWQGGASYAARQALNP